MNSWTGHAVLQVGVPALETWVRSRSAHYDPRFVSDDADFSHAHITVLAPLTRWDTRALVRLAADTEPFTYTLSRLATFPNGVIYLACDPEGPFRDLTARAWRLLPDVIPFGAPDPTPHLTLDACGEGVTQATTRDAIADVLLAVCRATHLDLVWYEADRCHVLGQWRLGGP